MCGIAGYAGSDALSFVDVVRAATSALRHRGPDAAGYLDDPCVVLGHRRLSIIDTDARSNQPLASPSGRTVIVFNGEIYNYAELKRGLEAQGERFVTTGDTEVLVRMLELDGVAAINRLRGMFAFAAFDRETGSLLLARDRFGEKPLFIAKSASGLAFASELRALAEFPFMSRRIDRDALAAYLETGYVPAPMTMFEGARSLEPGQWLRWSADGLTTGNLSRWHYQPDPALAKREDAISAVGDALSTAVKRQMVSDVPIGAFLSGGIDSSAVVAMMQRHSTGPVKTFNVRFEQAEYDESPIARKVAAHLGTEHHELTVADASFHEDDLWRVVDHVGQPFHDSSAIPTYVVARYARQHVTVALSGDGGDEMFGGYPVFRQAVTLERIAAVPGVARSAARGAIRAAMPFAGALGTRFRQMRKALEAGELSSEAERFRALHWLFDPQERAALLSDASRPPVAEEYVRMPDESRQWTSLRRAMYLRTRNELAGDMLVKVDRMAMATTLEVRAPMLDSDLADLSMRLPDEHLFDAAFGKAVLREAVRPLLPPELFAQPKWGFSIPLHAFANAAFERLARELLAPGGPLSGVIAPGAVAPVLARGLDRQSDRADYSVYQATHQLWALMVLAAWIRRFGVTT